MRVALGLSSALALLVAFGMCIGAKGAAGEIEGLIWLVVSAVLFAGLAIAAAIHPEPPPGRRPLNQEALREKLTPATPPSAPDPEPAGMIRAPRRPPHAAPPPGTDRTS